MPPVGSYEKAMITLHWKVLWLKGDDNTALTRGCCALGVKITLHLRVLCSRGVITLQ